MMPLGSSGNLKRSLEASGHCLQYQYSRKSKGIVGPHFSLVGHSEIPLFLSILLGHSGNTLFPYPLFLPHGYHEVNRYPWLTFWLWYTVPLQVRSNNVNGSLPKKFKTTRQHKLNLYEALSQVFDEVTESQVAIVKATLKKNNGTCMLGCAVELRSSRDR